MPHPIVTLFSWKSGGAIAPPDHLVPTPMHMAELRNARVWSGTCSRTCVGHAQVESLGMRLGTGMAFYNPGIQIRYYIVTDKHHCCRFSR